MSVTCHLQYKYTSRKTCALTLFELLALFGLIDYLAFTILLLINGLINSAILIKHRHMMNIGL